MPIAENINSLILSLPGDLPRQVSDELRRGWHARAILLEKEQAQAASQERTWWDGVGQHTLSITPEVFHYFGQRLGYGCWRDKKFRAEFARDNPGARVRSVARKTCLQMNGFKSQGGEMASREAHNLESAGSIPAPATNYSNKTKL